MNKIEKMFFDAYLDSEGITEDNECCILKHHMQIGIYQPDFVFEEDKIVIEIDGHDYHKTKEQRFNDYTRERYLMKNGYTVIRFMGTEVFLNAEKCVEEMFEIMGVIDEKHSELFYNGLKSGREGK